MHLNSCSSGVNLKFVGRKCHENPRRLESHPIEMRGLRCALKCERQAAQILALRHRR
jgi:hypothetical protein